MTPLIECPQHTVPLLDPAKVDALIVLYGWDDATVKHACERELRIARPGADQGRGGA